MKFLLLFMMLTAYWGSAMADTGSSVKAFKDWKSDKTQQIQIRINASKAQVDSLRAKKAAEQAALSRNREIRMKLTVGLDHLIQHYEKQVEEEQWNLEVAQDLSVTDYIILYLTSQPSKTRFQQAASQLSPNEIAELLEAYSSVMGAQAPTENLTNSNALGSSMSAMSAIKASSSATNQRQ